MFAVARKREADEVALARGILVAQAVVGKVVYLIIAEIENGNRLARARFLRAVSLVEQRGVPSIGAERNGRGKAVGAGKVAGDGERQALAGRKVNTARGVGSACDHEHDKQRGNGEQGYNGDLLHERWPRKVCTIRCVRKANGACVQSHAFCGKFIRSRTSLPCSAHAFYFVPTRCTSETAGPDCDFFIPISLTPLASMCSAG